MANPPTYSFCEEKQAQAKEITVPEPIFLTAYERHLNNELNLFQDAEAAKSTDHELEYPGKHGERKKLGFCLFGVLLMVILITTTAVTISVLKAKDARDATAPSQAAEPTPESTAPVISTRAETTAGLVIVTQTVTVSAEPSSTTSSASEGTTTVPYTPSQAPVTVTSSLPTIVSWVPFQVPVATISETPSTATETKIDPSVTTLTPHYSLDLTTMETSSSSTINTAGIVIIPLTTKTVDGVMTAVPISSEPTASSAESSPSPTVQETPTRTYYKDLPEPAATNHIRGGQLGFCAYPGSACMT